MPTTGAATVTFFVPVSAGITYNFNASYSGDGLYQPSTTIAKADFAVISSGVTLNVVDGSQASTTLSLVPLNGYTGTVMPTCSDLPSNALCRFQPAPLTITATGTTTLTVQIFTGINARLSGHTLLIPAVLIGLLSAFALRRRKLLITSVSLAVIALPFTMTGCSSTIPGTEAPGTFNTPAGFSTVTVTINDSTGVAHSGTIALNVISNGHD